MTKPVPQPAKSVLAARRITITSFGEKIGVNPHTCGRVLNGYVAPWPAFRRKASEYLGLPEEQLFHQTTPSTLEAS